MRRPLASLVLAVAGLVAGGVVLAGCGTGSSQPRVTYPPIGVTPGPAGGVAAQTRITLTQALAAAGYGLVESVQAYRPAEGPRLASASRVVLQVPLADDPDHGRIVVYELVSPAEAAAAAADQAAYVESGIGRVQFPADSRFVVRVVGATVVFFAWSAEDSGDPASLAAIAEVLDGVGSAP